MSEVVDAPRARPTDSREADTPAVRLDHVTKAFGTRQVLEDVSFEVPGGCGFVILGRSGTGKSVTLRHIIGLVRPDRGRVFVDGDEISALGGAELSRVRRKIGFLFQNAALFDSISVGENVAFPMRRHTDLADAEIRRRAVEKLESVGLGREYDKMPAELSGGMRKRAGLARALALDPELLFLDEPTAGLDPIGAAAFDELIENLKKRLELTVFLITHDLDTLYAICDRVAVLSDKKVVAVGTIDELLALDHPWIQEYFNGPRGRAASAGLKKGHRGS